jgi:hypothetical protein
MVRAIEKKAGPKAAGVVTVTSGPSYTVLTTDKTVLVDDDEAGVAVTVLLPAAADSNNRELRVKKLGSTAAVTVDGNGAETIDDATTQSIASQYDAMHIQCDGTGWWIL